MPTRTPTTDDAFRAIHRKPRTQFADLTDSGELGEEAEKFIKSGMVDRMTVTMKRPAALRLYTKGPFGWEPRTIAGDMLGVCMDNGFKLECQDCMSNECSGKPNECSGKPNVAFRRCPVESCRKIIMDVPDSGGPAKDLPEFDDPNEIKDDLVSLTAAQRTQASLQYHMAVSHPRMAALLGYKNPIDERTQPASIGFESAWNQMMGKAV